MSRELIDIKQIDVSKLNDVKIYDELPSEVEGQVAYCTGDGKLYYGDGSEWKEISTGEGLPDGTANGDGCTLRWDNSTKEWVTTPNIRVTNGITQIESTNSDYPLWITCNTYWGAIAITIPDNAENNIIHCMTGGGDNIFKIKYNGQIISKNLSGSTSSLIEALPDGTIQRSTQTIPVTGIDISLDTTNFDKNLDTTITDVQKLADKVDDLNISSLPTATNNYTLRGDGTTWVKSNVLYTYIDEVSISGGFSVSTPTKSVRMWSNDIMIGSYSNTSSIAFYGGNTLLKGNNSVDIRSDRGGGTAYGLVTITSYLNGIAGASIGMQGDANSYVNITKTQTQSIKINDLVGTGDRPVVADSAGKLKIGTASSTGRNYLEFLSDPFAVISDAYAFSNTAMGLDDINLNDKVKMVQCYVIQADYPNVKNNELVMGHNIEDGQISVRTNFNLAIGDRIKIYIEYID